MNLDVGLIQPVLVLVVRHSRSKLLQVEARASALLRSTGHLVLLVIAISLLVAL